MKTHAKGTFDMKTWDERTLDGQPWDWKQWAENPVPTLTRTKVTNTFAGDVEGESRLEYLSAYREDGACSFVGYERITGRIGDRSGSFVIQHVGVYADGKVKAEWSVVPASGAGDLRGLRGQGGFIWEGQHGVPTPFTLDYEFE